MGLVIDTQKQSQECRRRLGHCYICADPLPHRGTPEWTHEVTAEHVIPSSILALTPQPPGKDWPLVLDVHKRCDEYAKREADQLTKVIHVLNTRGPTALAADERGVVRNACSVGEAQTGTGESMPVLGGIDRMMRNVFLWARGFYAALYGQVPPAGVRQTTRAPAPGFDSSRPDAAAQVREQERSTEAILVLLYRASARGLSDRFVLLGGAIVFECAWFQRRQNGPWMCHWALDIPGSTKWALDTQGRDVPWHGAYQLLQIPTAATSVPLAELCKAK